MMKRSDEYKLHGKSYSKPSLFFAYFKEHYCTKCSSLLSVRVKSKIVNSESPEAKYYNFNVADGHAVRGNVDFRTAILQCYNCGAEYKMNEMRKIEKIKRRSDFAKVLGRHKKYINPKSWRLPDFIGWSSIEVARVLDKIGQKYEIVFADDEKANVNVVLRQYPAYGKTRLKDERLLLKVNNYYTKSNAVRLQSSYMNPIAEMGKWIYFTNGASMFRSCGNFEHIQKFYSHNNSYEKILTVVPRKEGLFFLLTGNSKFYLCLMQPNKMCKRIMESESCRDLFAAGDKLYMLCDKLIRYNTLDESLEEISYNERFIQHKGYRYYFRLGSSPDLSILCRQPIEGGEEVVFLESDKTILNFCLYSNSIYYIGAYKDESKERSNARSWLYKLDLNTLKNVEIKELSTKTLDTYRLFAWRQEIIVVSKTDILAVNTNVNKCSVKKFRIAEKAQKDFSWILCGNNIYRYSVNIEEGKLLYDGRYNLLTEEYEEFVWDEVILQ